MKNTWASGAIELLQHADSHISLESAFDRRIAFISIDNAIETMIRVFLSLPKSKSKITVSRKEIEEAENSFPKLLALFWNQVGTRLPGLDDSDIEHYHRIRNKLYHDGTGLTVDEGYLRAYRAIASVMLQTLFGVETITLRPGASLENLVVLWNQLENSLKKKLESAGIDRGHTYSWEQAMRQGVLTVETIGLITELRIIRNNQVHSTVLDHKKIEYATHLAARLIKQIDG
jgi:hypothetical protein